MTISINKDKSEQTEFLKKSAWNFETKVMHTFAR